MYGLLTEEQVLIYNPIAEVVIFNVVGIVFYYFLGSYIALASLPNSQASTN